MKTIVQFLLIIGLTSQAFATAGDAPVTQKVSLKNIMSELGIEQKMYTAIGLGSVQDIALTAMDTKARTNQAKMDEYPVEEFGMSKSGQWLGVQFHRAVVPDESKLDEKLVIVRIDADSPKVSKIISGGEGGVIVDFKFVGENAIIYRTLKSNENKKGQRTQLYFVDLKDFKTLPLKNLLPFEEITSSRIVTPIIYLVAHKEQSQKFVSVVEFDENNLELKVLKTFADQHNLDSHLLGFVEERSVFKNGKNEVSITFSVPGEKKYSWQEKVLVISNDKVDILNHKTDLRDGKIVVGETSSTHTYENGKVTVENENGSKSWNVRGDAFASLHRVDGGYVRVQRNHPNYGYSLLRDNGSVAQLSEDRFRLIHNQITENGVFGLGNMKSDDSVDLYKIVFGKNKNVVDPKKQDSILKYGYPQKYSLVERVPGGRYVIVRITPAELGVVDLYLDEEIIKRIPTLENESPLKISMTPNTFIFEFSGRKVVYSKKNFDYVFTIDTPKATPMCTVFFK